MAKALPGMLVQSVASEFGDRVFYVAQGRRHWVRDSAWLESNGFAWPADLNAVSPEALYAFASGSGAPVRDAADLALLGDSADSMDMREIAASGLRGTGIEFGSGASPFPVPLHCQVLYADAFTYESLCAHLYPGQTLNELVRPDFVTNLQTLQGIADDSLDFVVACHVIEHTVSPLTAIRSAWRALRPGGSLVLVVPDMTRTYDRKRAPTPLAHLIEDDRAPSSARDLAHYEEFYRLAFDVKEEDVPALAAERHAEGADIHYHCWTYEAFLELVRFSGRDGAPWSRVWSHPTLADPACIEFYFVLTK